LLRKQWRFEYFEAGKYQTLEEYFSQLCTCFAWGATDSDKVSFYLYSCENYVVPRGVQRIASFGCSSYGLLCFLSNIMISGNTQCYHHGPLIILVMIAGTDKERPGCSKIRFLSRSLELMTSTQKKMLRS
jgi:hypothetical protein